MKKEGKFRYENKLHD